MLTNLFQSALGRSTLIAPEDTWSLLALLLASVALAMVVVFVGQMIGIQ